MIDEAQQLWCAVIKQAVLDATNPLSARIGRRMEQIRAREWLTKPSNDFDEVCALAGKEPDRVRSAAVAAIDAIKPQDQPLRQRRPQSSYRGVVANFAKDASDQSLPSTQDRT
jgi:hypothetical protein